MCHVTVNGVKVQIPASKGGRVGEVCEYPGCGAKAYSNVVWYDPNEQPPRPSAPFCKEHGQEWRDRWPKVLP